MLNNAYKLPVSFQRFFENKSFRFDQCSLLESIDQNLELVLTTCPGEFMFNTDFGSKTWEMDFELVFSKSKWEDEFTGHIHEAIKKNEQRLTDIQVSIHMDDSIWNNPAVGSYTMRKKVTILIYATILQTGKTHGFRYSIFMGPLSKN